MTVPALPVSLASMSALFPRYLLASVAALAFDYGVLGLLVYALGAAPTLSAAAAYCAGAVVHYLLSRVYVFDPGWLHERRLQEIAGFLATGLAGLLVTVAVLEAGTGLLGLPVPVSKAAAVGLSFCLTYLLRHRLVFRRSKDGTADTGFPPADASARSRQNPPITRR